jgi:replicative DNA helicase
MTDTIFHKVPPQNIEAEESILSAILINNDTLIDILEILSAGDFYKTAHQIIFTGIETLYAKNEPVDLVTLSNRLRETDELEKIGGAAYLANLVDTVPMATNARHYARIVHDKAILRQLIEQSSKITQQCFEDRGEVERVIEFARVQYSNSPKGKTNRPFSPSAKLSRPTSMHWRSVRATVPWSLVYPPVSPNWMCSHPGFKIQT